MNPLSFVHSYASSPLMPGERQEEVNYTVVTLIANIPVLLPEALHIICHFHSLAPSFDRQLTLVEIVTCLTTSRLTSDPLRNETTKWEVGLKFSKIISHQSLLQLHNFLPQHYINATKILKLI